MKYHICKLASNLETRTVRHFENKFKSPQGWNEFESAREWNEFESARQWTEFESAKEGHLAARVPGGACRKKSTKWSEKIFLENNKPSRPSRVPDYRRSAQENLWTPNPPLVVALHGATVIDASCNGNATKTRGSSKFVFKVAWRSSLGGAQGRDADYILDSSMRTSLSLAPSPFGSAGFSGGKHLNTSYLSGMTPLVKRCLVR